ncbi:MAG: hypothetical protein ACYC5O_10395 [Anaerolineae bacterium]
MNRLSTGRLALVASVVGLVLLLAACGASTPQSSYADPFAYCSAVGTIDTPDARYDGPEVPDDVAQGLQVAMGLPTGTPPPPIAEGSSWRCMDGAVYACTVGANLPCQEKADTGTDATTEMKDYCKANPASDFIPSAVTGRATVYEWRCTNGTPEVVRQLVTPDARGFQSNIWYKIEPR